MRFNDAHKQIAAALKMTEVEARDLRSFMFHYHCVGRSVNAILAITRGRLAEERAAAEAKKAADALPPAAA